MSTVTCEVAVIGAGIIGTATAHYLSARGVDVVVIDRSYMGSGSTGRCIGGLRHQFSTPPSIRLMKESIRLFSEMEEEFGHSVEFSQGGYLLLAHSDEMAATFRANIRVQRAEGINVSLLDPKEAHDLVPQLNTEGLVAGAWCPDDGQAFPFAVLKGYRKRTENAGGRFILHNPVVNFRRNANFELFLGDGSIVEAPRVLLAAGPWTRELAKPLGIDLPLAPERHEAMITERMPRFLKPMLVDYRPDGCYFQQMLTGQVIGCYTPVPAVPGIREDVSFEFLPQVAWRMSRLVPALRNAAILRHWAGCYTMTPDGNPVLDRTPLDGLFVASGMCGHGFMFGPAMGHHMADFILDGEWGMDFSEFALDRDFSPGAETLK
ncbi:MAG: FAD-binding oxidoreductase [Candidatus Aminicenantes bacterium]|nr:FAD-binding oxidoreductase [Candidatus Aminicenantes bacterium]